MIRRRLTAGIAIAFICAAGLFAMQPPPANPSTAQDWRQVGAAKQRAKDLDGAIAAYKKALALQENDPSALYHIGTLLALTGKSDQAFEWLARAKATRRVDMTQLQADAAVKSLKPDPRFAALMPGEADFRDPFVEPVKVVREWIGEAMNDQFGWIARNIGDVDRDGIPDVVTSAPTKDIGGASAGRVYVYSTGSGRLLWQIDGRPGDELGNGVEGAGDTNADGTPDVIASAPGGGRAYVYSGGDGRVLLTFKAQAGDKAFGRHAAGIGDVDGDKHADVIVGAPGDKSSTGRAYVYSGKTGRALLTLNGERAGDGFGSAVAGASTSKHKRFVVGAPLAGPSRHGRVYVYSSLTMKPLFAVDADATGRALGAMFLAVLGDVDGDATPDVYASDWANAAKGPSTGRVYVHSGANGRALLTLTGETAGEGFGTSPSNAGDVDGDGRDDLIVGAWQYAGAALSGGRAYLYSGRDGTLIKTFTCRIPGDTFGFDAVTMGDVDKDGTTDFLITSAWSGIRGFHSGRMFIVSSGVQPSRLPLRLGKRSTPKVPGGTQ